MLKTDPILVRLYEENRLDISAIDGLGHVASPGILNVAQHQPELTAPNNMLLKNTLTYFFNEDLELLILVP